ncbi:formate acetyltransferase 3 [Salmonella enterica subsp. enterica]|uniref:Formate acetyltransferase 3 n=1 Tax=Salmonella enterica I TaxID=59201 RepID=A0A3S5DDC5_SALET|nr:formate acetyltransferase 3 [Salmonella enterica subsp. enterica]
MSLTVTRCHLVVWTSIFIPIIVAMSKLNQTLDREHAIELLHSCWLKLLEVNKIRSGSHSKASAGSPLYQNVTIGGQNLINGQPVDAVNPLSYAILESCGRLRSTQPNLSVRYHAGMSNDFLDACVQVIRCGFGMPAFNNDEIVIPEFIKLGIEPQDAYDYAAIGCIETAVGGKWGYRCTGMSFINFARVMLAALEGGRDATSGKVFLPQEKALSAGNFNNFDEVMAAWDTQIRYYTRKSIEIEYVVDTMLEENVHDILCSALVDDCIERAKSIKQGGAKYDWVSGLQVGIANLGNSLAAVKKLVFEQGVIGQQQLAAALADDFDGLTHEQLRQRLINGAPKYGNDDDSVDTLLARAYQTYIDELKQYHNPRYGRGPVGGKLLRRYVLYLSKRAIWRRDYGYPGWSQSAYTAGGRRKPCIRYGSSRPDGGDWFRRQITYRFHSRRRAAQPETEPNDAGKRIRQTETDGSATDVL